MSNKKFFRVRGSWPFPYDMLRYDNCYPASESDAVKMGQLDFNRGDAGVIEIDLFSCTEFAPTRKRWESNLWKVVP